MIHELFRMSLHRADVNRFSLGIELNQDSRLSSADTKIIKKKILK